MKNSFVLGIMSGTSIDSVDYAICEINDRSIKLRELWSASFPKKLQQQLHAAARGDLNSWQFCQLHHDLGRFYAQHATRAKTKPSLIGLHGQTVFHNPNPKNPATFQLGEPAWLAERLRAPVVNNFRAADMAAGGQGAPLATIFHRFVFGETGKHVCVNNLGGISNVTSINWKKNSGSQPKIMAFDTGPANMLIDFSMRHFTKGKKQFDKNGAWAAQGNPSERLLAKWIKNPYFTQMPPKSTGRELFGEPFFQKAIHETRELSNFDCVATFTELTARSLALNYKLHLGSTPDKVILTGGGAANPVLVRAITAQLAASFSRKIQVITSDIIDWPVQAIEPAAFALLAYLRLKNKAGNISETTGARRPVLCGHLTESDLR